MKYTLFSFTFLIILACSNNVSGQIAPEPSKKQKVLLTSESKKLQKNKKLVYDFWREVLEAGHLELADKYLADSYIQHNPNVPTGKKGFVDFFSKFSQPQPIVDTIKADLISVIAENDLVILSFVRKVTDTTDSSKNYSTTSFDMFRVENGKLAEHWDAASR